MDEPPRLVLHVLGGFLVERNGRPVPDAALGSRKQRTLLKLLAAERGRHVPAERAAEVLWDDPPPNADRLVATLVSRLRSALGRGAIEGGAGTYRLAPGPTVELDIDAAEALVDEAERRLGLGEPGLARAAAGGALEMLRRGSPFADEPYAEWADAIRTDAERVARRGREVAWRSALEVGEAADAVRAAEEAVAADPFDEAAYKAVMLAHDAAGRRTAALAAFERLRTLLATDLGVAPADETRRLRDRIAGSEPPDPGGVARTDEDPTAGTSRAATARASAGVEVGRPGRTDARPKGGTVRRGGEAPDPTFVGREHEIEELTRAWTAAVDGRPDLVLLLGEAGIGKTALASRAAVLARSTGGLVLGARSYEAERSLFLQPIVDALRPLVMRSSPAVLADLVGDDGPRLAVLLPELVEAIRVAPAESGLPELDRRHTFEAAADLIWRLTRRQPVLLWLDDLHTAGASTLEFVHFLLRRASAGRLLVIAASRVEEASEVVDHLGDVGRRLELDVLPPTAILRLTASMRRPDLADRLEAATRGHPLFVVETLRALAEGADGDDAPGLPLPETLRATVLGRVARTGPEVEQFLKAAAVLGSVFDLQAAAGLVEIPVEAAVGRIEQAQHARLVVASGAEFAFANDLIREILYAATPLPVRIDRHRRAARLLADRPEAVAGHHTAAGDWAPAAAAWFEAASRALDRYSNRDAEVLLSRAIDAARLAGDRRRESQALLARGRAREGLAAYAPAHEDHLAALDLARAAGDRPLELEALRQLAGDPTIALGRPPAECLPYLEAALTLARSLADHLAEIDTLRRLAVIETNRLRGGDAIERSAQAMALARAVGEEAALASALDAAKTVAAYTGDLDALDAAVAELEPILRRQGLLWQLQWTVFEAALAPLARCEWDAAAAGIDAALDVNRRTGYLAYRPVFEAHLGWLARARGDYGAALEIGRRTFDEARATGHPWWTSLVSAMLGRTLLETGDLEGAAAVVGPALEAAERDGAELYLVRCLGLLAEVAWRTGDKQRAAGLAARVEGMVPPGVPGPVFLHASPGPICAARALLGLDEPARAVALIEPVVEAALRHDWHEAAACGLIVLGSARIDRSDREDRRRRSSLERALELAIASGLPGAALEAHRRLAIDVTEPDAPAGHRSAAGDRSPAGHRAAAARLARELAASFRDPAERLRYESMLARPAEA